MKILLAIFLLPITCIAVSAAEPRPNIVLFFVDDLGWSNLGYRSPELFETPNIDRLAKEGIDFLQCYSTAPHAAQAAAHY